MFCSDCKEPAGKKPLREAPAGPLDFFNKVKLFFWAIFPKNEVEKKPKTG